MKLVSNIFLLALIWLICGARSCNENDNLNDQREKELLSVSRDSIKESSDFNSPSDEQLKAFEIAAIHKLSDFADYMKIVADTSIGATFRKQAAEMAEKLFFTEKINTRIWSSIYPEIDLNTLDKMMSEGLKKGMPGWGKPGEISVLSPMKRENDSTYTGKLSFSLECIYFDNTISPKANAGKRKIDIYAVKKVKTFGSEQLRVWEVYLGNMD